MKAHAALTPRPNNQGAVLAMGASRAHAASPSRLSSHRRPLAPSDLVLQCIRSFCHLANRALSRRELGAEKSARLMGGGFADGFFDVSTPLRPWL